MNPRLRYFLLALFVFGIYSLAFTAIIVVGWLALSLIAFTLLPFSWLIFRLGIVLAFCYTVYFSTTYDKGLKYCIAKYFPEEDETEDKISV